MDRGNIARLNSSDRCRHHDWRWYPLDLEAIHLLPHPISMLLKLYADAAIS